MAGEKIFELGFRIDTSPLAVTRTTAEAAAASVEKLGTAEEKLASSARALTPALDASAKAQKASADAADALAGSATKAALSENKLADAATKTVPAVNASKDALNSGAKSQQEAAKATESHAEALSRFERQLVAVNAAQRQFEAAQKQIAAAVAAGTLKQAEANALLDAATARYQQAVQAARAAQQAQPPQPARPAAPSGSPTASLPQTAQASAAVMGDAALKAAQFQAALDGLQGKITLTAANISQLTAALSMGGAGGGSGLLNVMSGVVGTLGRYATVLGPVGMATGVAATATLSLGGAYLALNKSLGEVTDKYDLMAARLRTALGSQLAAKTALDELKKGAEETGLGFQTSADAFLRFARANTGIGASLPELLQFTETIQKLGAISGASLGETQSALIQLGQALQSGRLQGDELRSISENAPSILKAIADGLGRTQGEIRAMGASGELTTRQIFDAILKATERTRKEFEDLPNTIEKNSMRISDAWSRVLDGMGKRLQSSAVYQFFQTGILGSIQQAEKAVAPPSVAVQVNDALRASRSEFIRFVSPDPRERARFSENVGLASDMTRPEFERQVFARYVDNQIEQMISVMENAESSPMVRRYREAQRSFAEALVSARADTAATESKMAENARRATVDRGMAAGREYDDYQTRLTKIAAARKLIEEAIAQAEAIARGEIGSREERDYAQAALVNLGRQLKALEQDAKSSAPELDRLANRFRDLQEAMKLGGGVSVNLITEAQTALQQAEGRMGGAGTAGTLPQFIQAQTRPRVLQLGEQEAQVRRQIDQQDALTDAQRKGAAAIREVEAAQRAANTELEMLGGPDSVLRQYPELVKAVRDLVAAQNDLTAASERSAQAQREQADAVALAATRAQIAAVGMGPTAMSRAAMEVRAREADRSVGGGAGTRMRQQFEAEQQLEDVQQATQTGREAAQAIRVLGMNPMQREREQTRQRVIDATERMTDPRLRQTVATNIQVAGEARIQDRFQQQQASLEAQRETNEQRRALIGLQNDEYRVQITLLEKRRAMEAEGIDRDVIDRQLAVTEEIERQNIAYEKQRARVEEIYGIIDGMSYSAKNLFTSMFEEAFKTGEISAKRFFQGLNSMIARAGAEMMYEIGVKPFVEAGSNFLKSGLQSLGKSLFPSLFPSANGSAWHPGGIQAFAMGGVVSSPTLFAFANGSRLGVMGEEGPEAIMPLRRGPDGRLGVASTGGSGGDVQVTVIDQRSSGDAAPVAVQSGTGPDGRRMISIMVRDEVRRAIRTGEMDAEMSSSFGASRIVQRR